MQIILDGSDGRLAFDRPHAVIRADSIAEVPAALAALETARAHGRWLAGFFAYELGYALEPRLASLMPQSRGLTLLLFGVFDAPCEPPPANARAYVGPLTPEWDKPAYATRFAAVKTAIAAGDIYQANLSFRAGFAFAGDARALYENLRGASGAPHCAFVDFADGPSRRQLVSLSPELFFEIEKGAIRARPMKGTLRRGGDDTAERAALSASPKERAENLMIVDLIRNDLGRVAEIGSVTVGELFAVETYPTLHTMVSTVTATLRPDAGIAEIVRALFPCGSVTGAPKIAAMEILAALESSPRNAYCGAIGYFAPDQTARFNVAIRTLSLADNRGTLGIGGGVVQDSSAEAEFAECLLKSRFFDAARRPLALIETMKFDGHFHRLERHLARMAASAQIFGLSFDSAKATAALDRAVADQKIPLRVRLTLDESGNHQATAAPLSPNPAHWTYALSPARTHSSDEILRHKTDWRELYEKEAARLATDEVIFRNERGELTEGARSNIFLKRGGKLLTPPISCGVLAGILRAELLQSGQAEEAVLTRTDLKGAELYFGNSLRGLIAAKPAETAP